MDQNIHHKKMVTSSRSTISSAVPLNTRNIEIPRPMRTQGNLEIGENARNLGSAESAIRLLETVHLYLESGRHDPEIVGLIVRLNGELKIHGAHIEKFHGHYLDKAQATLRNACRDGKLNLIARLHLLEIIELRSMNWVLHSNVINYYKQKLAQIDRQPKKEGPSIHPCFVPSFGHGGNILAKILPQANSDHQDAMKGESYDHTYKIRIGMDDIKISSNNPDMLKKAKLVLERHFDDKAVESSKEMPPKEANNNEASKEGCDRNFLMAFRDSPVCSQPPCGWAAIIAEYPEIVRKEEEVNPEGRSPTEKKVDVFRPTLALKRWDQEANAWVEAVEPSRS